MTARRQKRSSGGKPEQSDRQREAQASNGLQQLREILSNVANLLLMNGCSSEEVTREFNSVCQDLSRRPAVRTVQKPSKIDHAHIISHWYRDPNYLDAGGRPRSLAFEGRKPSLTSLISSVLPGEAPRKVTHSLLELGAIRRRGRGYEPTGMNVLFDGHSDHWAFWYMKALHAASVNMVHNLSCTPGRGYTALAATNPRFPVGELANFHKRVNRRTLRFLSEIDANMQRMEVADESQPTTECGVVVFAFEKPVNSRKGTPSSADQRELNVG